MGTIERLQIERFRGITNELDLEFPTATNIHVIFGENGTGKTSIIDAIDYITNKNLGSIKDKRAGSASNLPSLNSTEPAKITLTSARQNWQVTIGKGAPKFSSDELMGTKILRRSNVQRFIEATAGDKFAEVEHLLGIESVESAESSVREASKICRSRLQSEQKSIDNSTDILARSWEDAGSPGGDAISWAESLPSKTTPDKDEESSGALRGLHKLHNDIHQLQNSRASLTQAELRLQSAHEEIRNLPALGQYDAIALGRLLTEAEKVLTGAITGDECPVCEQPIASAYLAERLNQRRKSLKTYSAADDQATQWQRKVDSLKVDSNRQEKDVLLLMKELCGHAEQQHQTTWRTVQLIKNPDSTLSEVDAAIDGMRRQLQQAAGSKPLADALRLVRESAAKTDRLNRVEEVLIAIESRMREQRHAFAQLALDRVRNECNRIYTEIHPQENLGFSSISLDPSARSSLLQKGLFAGRDDVSPQAFYSEGHLDTLGFAFWLAHCKLDSLALAGKSVIVIDDVFSSVDADHLGRIVGLLFDESDNFAQIILATHSRVVRDAFLGAHGNPNKVNLIELNSFWNPGSGTRINSVPSVGASLRDAVNTENFDRQKAASKAGIALESLLLKLSEVFRINLPYSSRGEYELSILLDGMTTIAKKMIADRPVEITTRPMTAILTDLKNMKMIRNQVGAHFNKAGLETSNKEVLRFAEVAIELVDFATCPSCGNVPDKLEAGRFRCRCKSDQRTYLSIDQNVAETSSTPGRITR